jgi:hypothetical protein
MASSAWRRHGVVGMASSAWRRHGVVGIAPSVWRCRYGVLGMAPAWRRRHGVLGMAATYADLVFGIGIRELLLVALVVVAVLLAVRVLRRR